MACLRARVLVRSSKFTTSAELMHDLIIGGISPGKKKQGTNRFCVTFQCETLKLLTICSPLSN